jgi:hypothetical protein
MEHDIRKSYCQTYTQNVVYLHLRNLQNKDSKKYDTDIHKTNVE